MAGSPTCTLTPARRHSFSRDFTSPAPAAPLKLRRAMPLLDTHVHLLHPERFSYPWCAGTPALQRSFTLADYRAAAAGRVAALVFMEADVPPAEQQAEAAFFDQLAGTDRTAPALAAVIAGGWPESREFPAHIEALAANPHLRGLRRVLHTMPPELSQSALFAANLRLLPAHRLTFDLCARPQLLPAIVQLVRRCPETQFILDHCGVPDIAGGGFEPWASHLRELAALPNLACKLSGLPYCADPARPLAPQVQQFLAHCLECFGPRRLMWGSDWPVCTLRGHSLADWLDATASFLAPLTSAERNEIASGTARRLYRLP